MLDLAKTEKGENKQTVNLFLINRKNMLKVD